MEKPLEIGDLCLGHFHYYGREFFPCIYLGRTPSGMMRMFKDHWEFSCNATLVKVSESTLRMLIRETPELSEYNIDELLTKAQPKIEKWKKKTSKSSKGISLNLP